MFEALLQLAEDSAAILMSPLPPAPTPAPQRQLRLLVQDIRNAYDIRDRAALEHTLQLLEHLMTPPSRTAA